MVVWRRFRLTKCIPPQAALLGRFQSTDMVAGYLCKCFLILGVTAERLHVHRDPSLVFADGFQNNLVQLRAVITAVTFY
jgi:hypothetical protein